jgi:hypothetical protein
MVLAILATAVKRVLQIKTFYLLLGVLLLGGSLTQDELYTGQQLRDLKPKKKDIIMNMEWMINATFLLFNRERLYGKLFLFVYQ